MALGSQPQENIGSICPQAPGRPSRASPERDRCVWHSHHGQHTQSGPRGHKEVTNFGKRLYRLGGLCGLLNERTLLVDKYWLDGMLAMSLMSRHRRCRHRRCGGEEGLSWVGGVMVPGAGGLGGTCSYEAVGSPTGQRRKSLS